MPETVASVGGRLGYVDDGDSPNTQVSVFGREGTPLVFEVRGRPQDKASQSDKWRMDTFEGQSIGNVVHGENGLVRISNSYRSADFIDRDGVAARSGRAGATTSPTSSPRWANDPSLLTASIEDGHLSSAYCHLGILSTGWAMIMARVVTERWSADPIASEAWERMHEHLRATTSISRHAGRPRTTAPRLGLGDRVLGDEIATAMLARIDRQPFTFESSAVSAVPRGHPMHRRTLIAGTAASLAGSGVGGPAALATSRAAPGLGGPVGPEVRTRHPSLGAGPGPSGPTDACAEGGLEGVELRTTHAHAVEPRLEPAARAEVRARFADSPVACVGIGSDERFDSPDASRLAAAKAATVDFLRLSADVGGGGVKVKPDSFHEGVERSRTIEQIGESLRELGPVAADLGQEIRLRCTAVAPILASSGTSSVWRIIPRPRAGTPTPGPPRTRPPTELRPAPTVLRRHHRLRGSTRPTTRSRNC